MEDLVYYREGLPAGIIAPSTIFAREASDTLINGPAGIACATVSTDEDFHDILAKAGALIPGSAEEVETVVQMLEEPTTSRTVSYMLCSAKSCDAIIKDLKQLQDLTVMIVGCGGIGSSICMLLAGAGVRNFYLVDSDIIEKSNLNRQFFWVLKDVGEKKIHTLQKALEARFENLNVRCFDQAMGIASLCEIAADGVNAVALTADNPSSLARDAWKIAEHCEVPVVSGGYMHHLCSLFRFIPGDCEAVRAASELIGEESWSSLPSAIMPSYGPMNLSLAAELSTSLISSIAIHTFGNPKTLVKRWDSRVVECG
jgi:molybdopterin/thiamine biosynthesis adenylyltransferase